ncbi:VOC family protein [Actinocrispum wychmicini]|uniref:Putative glyoxalase superfamily protein PhnB n=1 Tax=Actinocrispum wychmicini TaxID=1213861 RepID=A0A4R2JBQ9_9PSEU|nr:VOC family protein [Actinocrispum wychmicini]TCO56923.1 putative glyoxalase superfamily protein PhnB [Actinocrispum wychmicini]
MTDPLDALRRPVEPVTPDPRFAAELRDKLRRAILTGEDMTTITAAELRLHTMTPYLAVTDARAALDFYVDVFGAVRRSDPIVMADGRIGHAELAIGDSVLMLADEYPEIRHVPGGSIRIEVQDAQAVVDRAVARGADLISPVARTQYNHGGTIRDPYGNRWLVAQAPPRAEPPAKHGEVGYYTFNVPDPDAAKEFYGAVLGWEFTPGRLEGNWHVQGSGLMGGVSGTGGQQGWKVMFAVDDLPEAMASVRTHGGQVGAPEDHPYGRTVDCVDNQGFEFWLWQQT